MTPIKYDGKLRSEQIKEEVKKKIKLLKKEKDITPNLVIVQVNRSKSTEVFTGLKQKAAEEVGANVEIYNMTSPKKNYQDVIKMIRYLDMSPEVHGVMVQLPFPKRLQGKRDYILDFIPPSKDVDGMGSKSEFCMPVVSAVMDAFNEFNEKVNKKKKKNILVIGSNGFVGRAVVKALEGKGHEIRELDRKNNLMLTKQEIVDVSENLDLIITATGRAGLLYYRNVVGEPGIIDVGAPKPEVNYESVKHRISYITPVPGGIGPVTIAYLLENLYQAAYNQTR